MTTTHTTRADTETVDALLEAFRHWRHLGELSPETHVPNLRRACQGHWFDADTLRFFGSRNLHLHRPGLLVETQTNAPGGTEYCVTAWLIEEDRLTMQNVGRFESLRAARRFAEKAHAAWPTFEKAHALRAAGCNADAAELVALIEAGLA